MTDDNPADTAAKKAGAPTLRTEKRLRAVGRRGGGRAGNTRGKGAIIDQIPWSVPVNLDKPVEPLPPEGIEAIHNNAMRILEEVGIEFLNPEAVGIFRKEGCTIENESTTGAVVKMDRAWVMEKIALAPSSFTLTPRNRDRQITIGGNHILFGNVSSAPNCHDLDRGRRTGDREAYRDFIKLTQYFNCIHFAGGYPVEPMDIHPSVRHFDCLYDKLTLTDKVVHAYSLGSERVEDVMEMVRIAGGMTHEEFAATPCMYTNINSTSPLKHDWPMIDGLLRLSRKGQATVVTPFTLAGAMSPITLAGTVSSSIAEALCAIALIQTVNPGCPCGFGTFSSNVDMKTGAPAFGTPDYMRTTQMTGQMARYYGLPLRSSNTCVSNAPDNQATWESSHSLFAAITSGSNMVYHAAGWLEGGLCAGYEKFVMDCEQLQQIITYVSKPAKWDEGELAFDAISEVGHGGHFFGIQHTQDRYEKAFYSPFLSDWSNFENWRDRGSVETVKRANILWKKILEEFEAPPMDEAIREELSEFVERRKREGGAPTDF
ncbi:trimethylamine methyltransferase family protein [Salaquimonas pukyongi]|uniref:trimethylamine methyltransferase family protein n=1 Tax=Salaquimonas pukyongi TaxID=2712698 RepID=UPI00096BACB5|nr:trimethylamine methyltransferase family protein [Salaquimonas pukyongi]